MKKSFSIILIAIMLLSLMSSASTVILAQNPLTTNEWTLETKDGENIPSVTGDAENGYNMTLTKDGTSAYYNYGIDFTDIANVKLVFAPTLPKTYLEKTDGEQFWTYFSLSTEPKASANIKDNYNTVQVKPVFVSNQGNVHQIVTNPVEPDQKSKTIATVSRGFFGIDDNFHPEHSADKGSAIYFVQEIGIDGNTHWYMKVDVPRVGGTVMKINSDDPTTEELKLDSHLQFDRFIGQKMYFSFGINSTASTGDSLDLYFKSNVAAAAKADSTAAVAEINSEITALPAVDDLTLSHQDAVEAAFNKVQVLGSNAAFVEKANITKLNELLAKMAQLGNEKAIADVEAIIEAVDITADNLNPGNISNYKTAITNAQAAYNNLGELKSQVAADKTAKLTALITKLAELDSEYQVDKAAADSFMDDVTAIGSAADLTVDNYTAKNAAIVAARSKYNDLNENAKSFIEADKRQALTDLEERIVKVKAAIDVIEKINALPSATAVVLNDKVAVRATRSSYDALGNDKGIVSADILKKLTDCEDAIKALQIAAGDWYVNNDVLTYTGNKNDGWEFSDSRDLNEEFIYATSTEDYDFTENVFIWDQPTSGSGSWFSFGLTSLIDDNILPKLDDPAIAFILRPQGANQLMVSMWAENEVLIKSDDTLSTETGVLAGFDYDSTHTFGVVKLDGHWYIKIDDHIFTGKHFPHFDEYMEEYGKSSHVRIGGQKGFRANLVNVGALKQSGDWWFSQLFGSASKGNTETGWDLVVPANSYAQYNAALTALEEKPITLNYNLSGQSGAPEFSFVTDKDSVRYPEAGKGVAIRLYTRPDSDPGNTHILAKIDGEKWETITAIPAIDSNDVTVKVEKDTDGHWYIMVGGTMLRSDNTEVNKYLIMDKMVGSNEVYLRVGSAESERVNVGISFASDQKPELTETEKFLLLFDEHFEAAKAGDADALKTLADAWNELNYLTRMDVEAYLMDNDEEGYDLLQTIKSYSPDKNSQAGQSLVTVTVVAFLVAISAIAAILLMKRKSILDEVI